MDSYIQCVAFIQAVTTGQSYLTGLWRTVHVQGGPDSGILVPEDAFPC